MSGSTTAAATGITGNIICSQSDAGRLMSLISEPLTMPARAMLMNRFTRQSRLLHPEQFRAVFNGHPDTVSDRLFRLLAISRRQPQSASMDAPEQIVDSRLGLAIAKKNVPKASQRNRIKRQIREAFRHFHCLQQAKLCNCDGDITGSKPQQIRRRRWISWYWPDRPLQKQTRLNSGHR